MRVRVPEGGKKGGKLDKKSGKRGRVNEVGGDQPETDSSNQEQAWLDAGLDDSREYDRWWHGYGDGVSSVNMIKSSCKEWWWTDDEAYWRLHDDRDESKLAGGCALAAGAMSNMRWVPKPKPKWVPKLAGSSALAADTTPSEKWVPKPAGSCAPADGTSPEFTALERAPQ